MRNKMIVFQVLFAFSGFAGLIYEGMWAKYLKLLIGHSSYGQVLALFVFMGGLALGSFLSGRIVDRIKLPLLWYVGVELLIGILGFLFHDVFVWSRELLWTSGILANQGAFASMGLAVLLGIMLSLPQATLLGATFPFAVAGIMRVTETGEHRSIPALYFANSIGGAIGILATSFWLVPRLGLPGTLAFAGCLNVLIAMGFYVLRKGVRESVAASRTETLQTDDTYMPAVQLLLLVSFATGLTSFFYEIGWIRILALILGSSTHAFDLMLCAFILGLGAGAFYVWATPKNRRFQERLVKAQILMGIGAAIGIIGAEGLFRLQNLSQSFLIRSPETWGAHAVLQLAICILLMCPASFFAGMTLPLLTTLLVKGCRKEAFLGHVYGWNTLGSIIGASIGGLLLLPLLGPTRLVAVGALFDVILGILLLKGCRKFPFRIPMVAGGVGIVVIAAVWVLPNDILVAGTFRDPRVNARLGADSLWVSHGRTATISVAKFGDRRSIATNGKPDGSVTMGQYRKEKMTDELTQAMCAWLPMAYHHGPRQVAMVGMGTGMSAHFLMADQRIEQLDLIEIEPEMIHLANLLRPVNERAFTDRRVVRHIEDARTFLARSGKSYDVIISEPSNPWVSGVASLFSEEFYRDMRRHLAPNGILVQWVQLYEFNDSLFASILEALHRVYPHVRIHDVAGTNDLIFIASMGPLLGRTAPLGSSMIQSDMALLGKAPEEVLNASILGSERLLSLMDGFAPVNSEFQPYVDQNAEKAMFAREKVGVVSALDAKDVPLQRWLEPGWASIQTLKNKVQAAKVSSNALRSVGFHPDCRAKGDAGCWDLYLTRLMSVAPVSTWPHVPGGIALLDSVAPVLAMLPDSSLGLYVKWRLGDTTSEPDSLTRRRAAILLRQGLSNQTYRNQVLWAGLFWGDPFAMKILTAGVEKVADKGLSLEAHILISGLTRRAKEPRFALH